MAWLIPLLNVSILERPLPRPLPRELMDYFVAWCPVHQQYHFVVVEMPDEG